MGIITDILKGLPISAIQAEKITALEKELELLIAENAELKKLATSCPRCRSLNWGISDIQPDPVFGQLGGNSIHWKCPDCGLSKRTVEG